MIYEAGKYDVVVVGAGHAGCEAALASARIGCQTLLVTLNIEGIALMPCNPSIGGPAKAQLVREIDALGGEMGVNVDETAIQMRVINTGKGPAVQALRAQADKHKYQEAMTRTLFNSENLDLLMAEVTDIESEDGKVTAIVTRTGAKYECKAIVVTSGTYLKGKIIIGDLVYEGGPGNQFPAIGLSESLEKMGIQLERFKTGTPPRIDRKSVDFSKMIEQPGDEQPLRFSFISPEEKKDQISCWLTHSNIETHGIVMDNIERAPLFSGIIKGKGPRYCPSFEDKVVRFSHKEAHQLFVEPEGIDNDEMYVQGLNTSMPEDVQISVLRSIPGLENVRIIRTGYAIEYDHVISSQLKLTLESKKIEGLFTAGQLNGTSGYEEAAAQGLVAGINAALKVKEREPFVLKRSEAYIGVLIDDLVTKDIDEPYRLLTSRSEYRLLLRQDNADLRLCEKGRAIGLVKDDRWEIFQEKRRKVEEGVAFLKETTVSPSNEKVSGMFEEKNTPGLRDRISLWALLRRPEIKLDDLVKLGFVEPEHPDIMEQLEIQAKYEGYINKQQEQVKRFEKMEEKQIPPDIDYKDVYGLSNEALQKLTAVRPVSIGQASRVAGVSPADINVLLIYMEKKRRK
ncbi:MAG: tRNA uridine-5-carboxymethylaminomethyl(34) synthesis enzyme MnmG [Bacillota bacterium]|nr:tRNA uridine-5-carboxymethylaminomethyl(34) synthesis enzyme MnmG [Bacillota bacterium]